MSEVTQIVRFNGYNLNDIEGLRVVRTDPFRPPSRDLTTFDIANADKSTVSSAFYHSRTIHVECTLNRDGKSGLEQGIYDIQEQLQGREKLLTFNQAGTEVEYTATMANFMVKEYEGGFATIDLEFTCSDPYSYAVASTTVSSQSAVTASSTLITNTWNGNTEQAPVITITINTLTLNGDTGTITLVNTVDEQTLEIEDEYSANDVLVVDCKNRSITVNDTAIDFTGPIPTFNASDSLRISDDFTARNIDIDVTYQVRNI